MSFLFGAGVTVSRGPFCDPLFMLVSLFCLLMGRSYKKKKHEWLQGREELIVAGLVLLAACLEEERREIRVEE